MHKHRKDENVKVEHPGDLMYLTYYMINWEDARQSPSEQRCLQCGRPMQRVEAEVVREGLRYEGLVCHVCKRVLWVRQG